jgi:(p)ppGpp synthase/HD superfamily hydrolase
MANGIDDGPRIARALAAAAQIHATQMRKGTDIPYLAHLLGTCSIALEYGAKEDEAIAALLHDAIEDGRPADAARATVATFGEEVLRIVEACTQADGDTTPDWHQRKADYLASISRKDRAVLLVSASDKLHNARAILRDLRDSGESLWGRFGAPKHEVLWYYRELVTAFAANCAKTPGLVAELDRTVTEIEALP